MWVVSFIRPPTRERDYLKECKGYPHAHALANERASCLANPGKESCLLISRGRRMYFGRADKIRQGWISCCLYRKGTASIVKKASSPRGSSYARFRAQLGPASGPLIHFGNLSVAGIDLMPTRGSKGRRMVCRVTRKEMTCQLSYPTIRRKVYAKAPRMRGKINHGKSRLDRARSVDYLCPSFSNRRLVDR